MRKYVYVLFSMLMFLLTSCDFANGSVGESIDKNAIDSSEEPCRNRANNFPTCDDFGANYSTDPNPRPNPTLSPSPRPNPTPIPPSGNPSDASSLSQFGITWTFDRQYQVGQFANGDYWVVGPVTIIRIDPISTQINGRTINGSMINPDPDYGSRQGYDSLMYTFPNNYSADFDPDLNVARPSNRDLSSSNPLFVQVGSSLVSVISRTMAELQSADDPKANLKTAAILTVLDQAPTEGSFRPPYSGTEKSIRFNRNQLDYSVLAKLAPVSETPALSTVERKFQRPWLDHVVDWKSGYLHPVENLEGYGARLARDVGDAALMLNLNFTAQRKERLLIYFVQVGIDLTGVFDDGGFWAPNGGISLGRKLPILISGFLLNDQHMKNVGNWDADTMTSADPQRLRSPFQEDSQTFYVEETSPGIYNHGNGEYTAAHVGLPEWGVRHETKPGKDNAAWDAPYRHINGWALTGHALAVHVMGLKEAWNNTAFFDYMDRFFYIDYDAGGKKRGAYTHFVRNMWLKYRKNYGAVWND